VGLLIFLAIPGGAGATSDWWNSEWLYRVSISVDETSGNALTDYPVMITVDTATLVSEGKMKADCGDIRFTDSTGNELAYWLEGGCNSADTKIWVKLPSITASSTETIYLYHGNPSALSAYGDPRSIYLFWDDFENSVIDGSLWDIVSDYPYNLDANGLFASYYEPGLSVDESSVPGYLRIAGTGTVRGDRYNCVNEDVEVYHSGCHLGKGLRSKETYDVSGGILIKTKMAVQNATLDHAVTVGLSIIQDKDNRFDYFWMENDADANNFIHWGREVNDSMSGAPVGALPWPSRPFTVEMEYKLGADAILKISGDANGEYLTTESFTSGSAKIGLFSTVRFPGNSIDIKFDYILARKYVDSEPATSIGAEEIQDLISPTTSIAFSGITGNDSWYTSNVEITLTATDNEGGSGVAKTEYSFDGATWNTYTAPFTITNEGTTMIYYRSIDSVGNVEERKTREVKIDKTPPVVTITSPEAKDYLPFESIIIDFSVIDTLSGIDPIGAVLDSTAVANGQVIDLKTLTIGQHTLTVSAVDKAGNSASRSATFNVKPISATVDIKPDTLNKDSKSDKSAVTVYIELPSGFDVNDIDVSTITLSTSKGSIKAQLSPTKVGDYDSDGILDRMVKFSRQAVIPLVDAGEKVKITISGKVAGVAFEGSDEIRVIGSKSKKKSK